MTNRFMDPERARLKVQALLHDTPDKAILLGHTTVGHEALAVGLLKRVLGSGLQRIDEIVKGADRAAAGADRLNLPKGRGVLTDFLKSPELRHPLDGTQYELPSLGDLDPRAVADRLEATLDQLLDSIPEPERDPERLYWMLYHDLPAVLWGFGRDAGAGERAELGALWQHLPADTRVPDHSIWEHCRLTSALAGARGRNGDEPALLVVSVTPVQSFIAAARRLADLWAGSFLLSWLAWQGMAPVVRAYGADAILMPDLSHHPYLRALLRRHGLVDDRVADSLDAWESELAMGKGRTLAAELPNRFVCLLPAAEVEPTARTVREAIHDAFQRFCRAGLDRAAMRSSGKAAEVLADSASYPREQAERQAREFLQVHWASVLWPGDLRAAIDLVGKLVPAAGEQIEKIVREAKDADLWQPNTGAAYPALYKLLERAHGAAKSVRRLSPNAEPGHKCTLLGDWESIHPRSPRDVPAGRERDQEARRLWSDLRAGLGARELREGERLSAIGLGKRLGRGIFSSLLEEDGSAELAGRVGDMPFPSTYALGAADTIIYLAEHLGRTADTAPGRKLSQCVVRAAKAVERVPAELRREWLPAGALGAIRRLTDAALRSAMEQVARAGSLTLDATLYEDADRLVEIGLAVGSKDGEGITDGEIKEMREACRALVHEIKERGIRRTSPYYAALKLDGDRMGGWLGGDMPDSPGADAPPKLSLKSVLHSAACNALSVEVRALYERQRRPMTPARHAAISRTLAQFSRIVVPRLVEEVYGGVLVYAGGDDVLALLPVSRLLPCLRDLRAAYSGLALPAGSLARRPGRPLLESGNGFVRVMGRRGGDGPGIELLVRAMGRHATCSAGAIIAHSKTPLRLVLSRLDELEKEAKSRYDRDAFCIGLAKRSGSFESAGGKWAIPAEADAGEASDTLGIVMDLQGQFQAGRLGRRFAYRLSETLPGLAGIDAPKAVEGEILRLILQHSRRESGDGAEPEADAMNDAVDGAGPLDARAWAGRLALLCERVRNEAREPGRSAGAGSPSSANISLAGIETFHRLVGLAEFLGRDGRTGGDA